MAICVHVPLWAYWDWDTQSPLPLSRRQRPCRGKKSIVLGVRRPELHFLTCPKLAARSWTCHLLHTLDSGQKLCDPSDLFGLYHAEVSLNGVGVGESGFHSVAKYTPLSWRQSLSLHWMNEWSDKWVWELLRSRCFYQAFLGRPWSSTGIVQPVVLSPNWGLGSRPSHSGANPSMDLGTLIFYYHVFSWPLGAKTIPTIMWKAGWHFLDVNFKWALVFYLNFCLISHQNTHMHLARCASMCNKQFIQLTNSDYQYPHGCADTSQEVYRPQIEKTCELGILGLSESFQCCNTIILCPEKWSWCLALLPSHEGLSRVSEKMNMESSENYMVLCSCMLLFLLQIQLGSFQEIGKGFKMDCQGWLHGCALLKSTIPQEMLFTS